MVCQKYMKWYTAGIPKVYWMVFKRHIQGILKVYQRFIQDIFMVNKIVNQTHIEAIIKICSLYITYGWSRHASYSGSTSSKKQPCPKKTCKTYISWVLWGALSIYIYIYLYVHVHVILNDHVILAFWDGFVRNWDGSKTLSWLQLWLCLEPLDVMEHPFLTPTRWDELRSVKQKNN